MTLEAAFVLIDVIEAARATVRLQCRGRVEGPAVGVVAAGDERSASSHTVFRLIAPSVAGSGTAEQMVAQSEAHRALLWRFQARVARATGRPVEDVAEDMRKGRYLEARQAARWSWPTPSGGLPLRMQWIHAGTCAESLRAAGGAIAEFRVRHRLGGLTWPAQSKELHVGH